MVVDMMEVLADIETDRIEMEELLNEEIDLYDEQLEENETRMNELSQQFEETEDPAILDEYKELVLKQRELMVARGVTAEALAIPEIAEQKYNLTI